MKLEFLKLENFRCFSKLHIEFDERLTVVVGANGSGKTSILDAVAVFLKALMKNMEIPSLKYLSLTINKLERSLLTHESILYSIKFKNFKKINLKFKDSQLKINELEAVQDIDFEESGYKKATKNTKDGLHIFAFYGAQRCLLESYSHEYINTEQEAIFRNAFSTNIDYQTSLAWFDEKDAEEARYRSNNYDLSYRNPELQAVREAIAKALGGHIYDFPHMNGVPPELYINNIQDGLAYRVIQLSEGYKTMLALIMDLARRMAVGNGKLFSQIGKSVLETNAIVLIDEIELHLHPSWQQTVLPSLLDIFPNTQFIVSTHSPQVLTSIKPENIRILFDGKILPAHTITYGTESSHVLNAIFGVPSRPDNEVKRKLDEYLHMVNAGQGKTPEALVLRKELEAWITGDPILTQADMFIRRNERHRAREAGDYA